MKTMIALVASIMMMGCSGINNTGQMNTLPDILQVGQNILSRDTVEQDIYPTLTSEQRNGLSRQTTLDVPDSIRLIGVRPVEKGITLAAYMVPMGEEPDLFKVYLVTHDSKDAIVDAVDLGFFHTSEHKKPMTFGGNRFYTTDVTVAFDDARHFVSHHVMTLTSLYLKNHTLTELWRVEWDNRYEISDDGRFSFKGQQETFRTEGVDDPIIDEYKSRNLAVKD